MRLNHQQTLSGPKNPETSNGTVQLPGVYCLSISNDMAKLAVCLSGNNHVELYDFKSNQLKDKFSLKPAGKSAAKDSFRVTGMAFSIDSERLAIGQTDCVIYVYKIGQSWGQKKSIVNKYTLNSAVSDLHWLANGIIFSSIDGRVKFIQTQTNKMSTLIQVANSVCVSLCYNQDQVVAGFLNGQIWANSLSLANNRESTSMLVATHTTAPLALALTSTGYICAAGCDGRILFQEVVANQINEKNSSRLSHSSTSSSASSSSKSVKQSMEYGQDISKAVASPPGTVLVLASRESLLLFELQSRTWKHKWTVDLNGCLLITGLCWSCDGTKLVASTINQAVELFECRWQSKIVANRFEINYVGNRQIVVKDLQSNHSAMFSSTFDIQQVRIFKDNFIVIWTSNTLIMANLLNQRQRSEIEWTGLTTRGIKFSFDYENVALISAVGELYLVELGQNQILGSVRTDFISPHLISVRMNERKSTGKVLAYLLDVKTIAVIDLITGLQLNTWSHTEKIDWIELNETGHRLIFRDKALKLVLLLNVVRQDLVVLLNSSCGFVQWVPGSDVIVAQSKDKLYVWYDYEKPVIHQVIGGEMNEAFEIERSNQVTKVRFTQPNTDIILDEVLLEFDTAIEDGDLQRAESFLESLTEQSSSQSAINDSNSMWLTLGNLALKNLNLSVAERAFAAIGDLAKVNFIHRCQEDASMLALLESDWDRFESGNFETVLSTYLNTFNWQRAIKLATKFGRHDLVDDLKQKQYQWLLDTGQYSAAAQILEQDGKLEEAIQLYLKASRFYQITRLIVSHFNAQSDPSSSANSGIDKNLVEKVIKNLEEAEAWEEAGDLYQLAIIDDKQAALRCFVKAKAYPKAIDLARQHFPDQVVSLELQYGEHLLNELDDPSNAVNHFIEAGRTERALEAAVQARQFDRAAEIASILESVPSNIGKKIAEHFVSRDQVEEALEMYLNMGCVREAVQLLNERGQYARAFKIAKQLMSAEEAREMYELIARSYESEGKWREAERIYVACGDVDGAISMYKNNRQFDSMIRLVRQHHPALLNETCIYLARQLQSERLYKQAEQYYLMASQWQQAALMYQNAELWEDAYRVSRAHGGATAAKQVAFDWAQTINSPQESVALLNRFGLLNQVVDYALENKQFEFALALIANSNDLKHKLLDVRLKYAMWLESEGHLNEAEKMYVDAGRPKEAVVMYLHRNQFDQALRVAEHLLAAEESGADVVKDVLTAQARFLFEQMKRSNNYDRLDKVEALLLRAGRIETGVRLFRDANLWEEAVRLAEQYAPHLLESLRRDMISSHYQLLDGSSVSEGVVNSTAQMTQADTHNEMSQSDLTAALKKAEQNGDNESIVHYSILLSTRLLQQQQAFDSLRVLAKHASSTFILADSKKLMSRIAMVILSGMDDITMESDTQTLLSTYSLLRDCLHQLLVQNSSLNQQERELLEKYLLISHYLTLKCILEQVAKSTEPSSPAMASVKELHLKLTVALLRYTDVIRADRAFFEAGLACRAANRLQMAFVFLNHLLDLLDAIEERNFNVDHSDFVQTDIPSEVPLPDKITFEEETIEDIKSWVLQTSMDTEIEQTLPLDPMRDGQVYEASLINADQSRCLPCLVTGYPVVKHRMILFVKDKYAVNKEDWNKLLMATKILDEQPLRQVLQFIGTLCGNSNLVKFSFQ